MRKGWQASLIIVTSRFYPMRWLEDEDVAIRAVEIWENVKATEKYWESLIKSKRPSVTSYQTCVSNISDLLVPAKLQFFAFFASIFKLYLIVFKTDFLMIPFIYEDLSHILHQLIVRFVFKREALVKANATFKKMKKTWFQNSDNHLEDQLVDVGAAT